jgi:hypothetical protein
VYSLVGVQLCTIRERLTKQSEVLALAVNVIFSYLRMKQLECRNDFLTDLECCCAAANDFIRMSDQCEEILADLESASSLSKESLDTLAAQSNELLTLCSSDAAFTAQRVYVYIFEPIEEQIGQTLFDAEWEESLTHNELTLTSVRTLEDYGARGPRCSGRPESTSGEPLELRQAEQTRIVVIVVDGSRLHSLLQTARRLMIVMTVMTLITCVLANIIEIAMKNHESGKALCVYITILSALNPKGGGGGGGVV